jgi:hypothetical protein
MAGKIAVNIIAVALLLSMLKIPSFHLVYIIAVWLSVLSMAVSLVIYAKRLFIGRIVGLKN